LQNGASVFLKLKEVVIIVAFVSDLLIKWYFQTNNFFTTVCYLCFQLDVIFILNISKLFESFRSFLYDHLLLFPQYIFNLLLLFAYSIIYMILKRSLKTVRKTVRFGSYSMIELAKVDISCISLLIVYFINHIIVVRMLLNSYSPWFYYFTQRYSSLFLFFWGTFIIFYQCSGS
jgi:hypothetical protein